MSVQTVIDDLRSRPGTGDTIPIINPVTEEQYAEFTDGGAKAVDEAVAGGRRCRP
jgi:phenylacetaldehyde dehydrogenase